MTGQFRLLGGGGRSLLPSVEPVAVTFAGADVVASVCPGDGYDGWLGSTGLIGDELFGETGVGPPAAEAGGDGGGVLRPSPTLPWFELLWFDLLAAAVAARVAPCIARLKSPPLAESVTAGGDEASADGSSCRGGSSSEFRDDPNGCSGSGVAGSDW